MKNIVRLGRTMFVPLPVTMRRPIAGGCQCRFCRAHPLKTPEWDTLAFDEDDPAYTWAVHYPEAYAR